MKCNFSDGTSCALVDFQMGCDGEDDKLGCPFWEMVRAWRREPKILAER
jgi:hypothetical protein